MNKEQKLKLINEFRDCYKLMSYRNTLGVFSVINQMHFLKIIDTYEMNFLNDFCKPKFQLQEIEIIENLHWIDEQIDLISYEN
jgi:hypothetical protein